MLAARFYVIKWCQDFDVFVDFTSQTVIARARYPSNKQGQSVPLSGYLQKRLSHRRLVDFPENLSLASIRTTKLSIL